MKLLCIMANIYDVGKQSERFQALIRAFPVFFPVIIPMKASGIFSNPSVNVSRILIFPCSVKIDRK